MGLPWSVNPRCTYSDLVMSDTDMEPYVPHNSVICGLGDESDRVVNMDDVGSDWSSGEDYRPYKQ